MLKMATHDQTSPTETAKCGTGVDEAHQPMTKICTNPDQGRKSAPVRTRPVKDPHQPTHQNQ